jgi:hypothetical protein
MGDGAEQHGSEPQRGEHADERDQHAPRSDYHYVDVAADYDAQHDYDLDGPYNGAGHYDNDCECASCLWMRAGGQ